MITSHQYRANIIGDPCMYKYYKTSCGRMMHDHDEVDYEIKAALENTISNNNEGNIQ